MSDEDMTTIDLNDLKRYIFFDFMDKTGRAFVLVRYSENVMLGNRGFTKDEMQNGIILIFNSRMKFTWDDYGISATLVFGTSPQKCFIPPADIIAVYSPELNAQFVTSQAQKGENVDTPESVPEDIGLLPLKKKQTSSDKQGKNVISVDFTKKRKT
jgi:hypothetical protein